jgi:hypothetical protein
LFLQWSSKVLLLPQARCMEKLCFRLIPALRQGCNLLPLYIKVIKGPNPAYSNTKIPCTSTMPLCRSNLKRGIQKASLRDLLVSRFHSHARPHTPAHQHKHFRASASSTFFDDSALPDYSIDQKDTDAPSFSQVVLTLDPTWSFIEPVTNLSNQAIPLYAISTDLNEDRSHITTIQRLYHRFSDTPSPSSKGARVKRTALPVYEIGPGRTRCELKPLLESRPIWN